MNAREGSSGDADRGGESGGRREPLRHPTGADGLDRRLQGDNHDAAGEFLEDAQRDRHSKGVAGGYDDAIDAGSGERERGPQQSD
jgi:hypothetical protein